MGIFDLDHHGFYPDYHHQPRLHPRHNPDGTLLYHNVLGYFPSQDYLLVIFTQNNQARSNNLFTKYSFPFADAKTNRLCPNSFVQEVHNAVTLPPLHLCQSHRSPPPKFSNTLYRQPIKF